MWEFHILVSWWNHAPLSDFTRTATAANLAKGYPFFTDFPLPTIVSTGNGIAWLIKPISRYHFPLVYVLRISRRTIFRSETAGHPLLRPDAVSSISDEIPTNLRRSIMPLRNAIYIELPLCCAWKHLVTRTFLHNHK